MITINLGHHFWDYFASEIKNVSVTFFYFLQKTLITKIDCSICSISRRVGNFLIKLRHDIVFAWSVFTIPHSEGFSEMNVSIVMQMLEGRPSNKVFHANEIVMTIIVDMYDEISL